jgi:hypothetical protein
MRRTKARTGLWTMEPRAFRSMGAALLVFLAFGIGEARAVNLSIAIDGDSTASSDSMSSTDWERGSKDVVRMGQDINIGVGETVEGDVVAIGGRITIEGTVKGDAVSIGGGIHLLPGAVVHGDVVSVGGRLKRDPGATVMGQNVSIGPAGALGWIPRWGISHRHHESSPGRIGGDVARAIVFFLIGLIMLLAFPRRMAVVRETIRTRFWLSLVVGFGSLVGVTAALVILMITCIGILVAVPGAFLFVLTIVATGTVAAGLIGEAISRRGITTQGSWVRSIAFGILILLVIQIIGRLLASADGGFIYALGRTILILNKAAGSVLAMVGFGSLVLSRLGARTVPPQPWTVPTPPPPPFAGMTTGTAGGTTMAGGVTTGTSTGSTTGSPAEPPPIA